MTDYDMHIRTVHCAHPESVKVPLAIALVCLIVCLFYPGCLGCRRFPSGLDIAGWLLALKEFLK